VSRSGISTSTSKSLDAIYGARPRFGGSASTPTTASQSLTTVPTRDLQSAVLAASRSVGADARVGIAARNLTTGEQVNIRSAELFPSASVNKLAIMVEAFRQFSTGKLVRTSSISHDLERMILLSDNDAANRLLDKLGEKEINAGMVSLGLPSTQMRNYFSLSRGPRDPGFNQTTPSDTALLLTLIATDRAVNPASSQEMRALLHRAHDATKLVGGLPPGTKVAHKSGWYAGVANDAGIVYPNGRGAYILAVFSEGSFSAELGNQLVAAVSKASYQAWGR
jgi:beta-lactamase class A